MQSGVVAEFELVSFNFATTELILRKKVFDNEGNYEDTLSLITRVPEFRDKEFRDGMKFRVAIEEVTNEG